MKNKVFTRLEPKAKSYGFSKDELMTVCESVANGFSSEEEATDEAIDARIDAYLPILKLSQSAAHRSYERMKAKFEEENKPQKQQEPPKPAEPQQQEDEAPAWFKAFQQNYEKDKQATEQKFERMATEKANERFMARAHAGLKDVDPKFYRDLKSKAFESDEEVDAYVSEVTGDWTTFCAEKNIKSMSEMTPPGGRTNEPVKPNEGVLARVEARRAEETKSAIKGLD